MSDLLFEIGTEELPAGFLLPAANQLADLFAEKAGKLQLTYTSIRRYCTPRRLAMIVSDLIDRQPDSQEELLGPSRQAAFDQNGKPTKAAEGFARSKGVTVDQLSIVETPKGEYLQLVRRVNGEPTVALLPGLLGELITELSFAKSMKWGSNQTTFARPIQWLVARYGDQTVDFSHEGMSAGVETRGHRFLAPESFQVESAEDYEPMLEERSVIADFDRRRRKVLDEIKAAAVATDFGTPANVLVDEELLDLVTNLVEYPVGVCGRFDDKFLQVPDEVLITSMREHQKYFPIVNQSGGLLPGFVAVNNTKVKQPSITREGHEKVLRARLSDAFFFFDSDKKVRLEDRVGALSGIIFQAKLGSMQEKCERIVKLSRLLAERLEPELVDACCRSAKLCKADLTSSMVGEFPSLQGSMGASYAMHDGEPAEVALAIKEHYMPLRSGAALPTSGAGAIVALADRIDTIAGCFGIGQVPTGTTDPFGLRRLALGILHIIEDRAYTVGLPEIFQKALALYGDRVDGGGDTVNTIIQFVKGRFVNDCNSKGLDSRAVDAVTSVVFTDVNDCLDRIAALSEIRSEASFEVLAGSFKRIRNITKDNGSTEVYPELFQDSAEKKLYEVYAELAKDLEGKLAAKDYRGFLTSMLVLKEPVDRFFDDVMVMAEDQKIRSNRLNLLTALGNLILEVGDISRMHSS